MKKLIFDSGMQKFEVNGGEILRFNPSDMNIYNRFFAVAGEISALENDFIKQAKAFSEETQNNAEQILHLVAGGEIRTLPFLHWWTFLGYFRAVGEGQFSAVVGIREKLRKGQKLEKWEQEFYAENKSRIDLKKHYTNEEQAERKRLKELLEK